MRHFYNFKIKGSDVQIFTYEELTCGKDHIPGNQFVVDNGKLGEFNSCHPSHSSLSSFPVEFYIICCVTIYK